MKVLLLVLATTVSAFGQSINGVPESITAVPASSLNSTSGFGLGALQVCHAEYSFANDGGGAPGLITPLNNCTIPARAIMFGSLVNWTTAGAGALNTTSIGVSGTGGGPAVIMSATAVASLTSLTTGLITFSNPVKITTSGTVTLTTAVSALTAGVCEIYIFFVVSPT